MVGANWLNCTIIEMDFHEGGTSLVSMQAPEEMGRVDLYNTWST